MPVSWITSKLLAGDYGNKIHTFKSIAKKISLVGYIPLGDFSSLPILKTQEKLSWNFSKVRKVAASADDSIGIFNSSLVLMLTTTFWISLFCKNMTGILTVSLYFTFPPKLTILLSFLHISLILGKNIPLLHTTMQGKRHIKTQHCHVGIRGVGTVSAEDVYIWLGK